MSRVQTLSRREEYVLVEIADGMNSQEIADELFLSVETVKSHVTSMMVKVRARNRPHAVALAYHSGLLKPVVAA